MRARVIKTLTSNSYKKLLQKKEKVKKIEWIYGIKINGIRTANEWSFLIKLKVFID